MTHEQLNSERRKNLQEIETIQKQISAQVTKNPVNAMYERINYLTERNREIEVLLMQLGDTKITGTDVQMDIATSIAAGGGGVPTRPQHLEPDDSLKSTIIKAGNKITAVSAQSQSTQKK